MSNSYNYNPNPPRVWSRVQNPCTYPSLENATSLLDVIAKQDVFLHFPYQKFDYVVDILLKNGCPLDAVNQDGDSALMLASRYGHLNVVGNLIEKGCQIDAVNNDGDSAYVLASRNGHHIVVDILIAKGALIRPQRPTAHANSYILARGTFGKRRIEIRWTPSDMTDSRERVEKYMVFLLVNGREMVNAGSVKEGSDPFFVIVEDDQRFSKFFNNANVTVRILANNAAGNSEPLTIVVPLNTTPTASWDSGYGRGVRQAIDNLLFRQFRIRTRSRTPHTRTEYTGS